MANPVFNRVRDRLFARDAISTNSDTRSTSLTLSPGTSVPGFFLALNLVIPGESLETAQNAPLSSVGNSGYDLTYLESKRLEWPFLALS